MWKKRSPCDKSLIVNDLRYALISAKLLEDDISFVVQPSLTRIRPLFDEQNERLACEMRWSLEHLKLRCYWTSS